jgi:hypothetical protein
LYWVIIFIPPIYTQTIVKWVAKEGERTRTQTPTLPFTPNPSPKKPKNLNPNTLFFFSSYIDTYPENLILEAMQVQTEEPPLSSSVAAVFFGSQDLGFRISVSGPRFQDSAWQNRHGTDR